MIQLDNPTLIWRAPARGSSGRSAERRAIFVDGSFTYEGERLAGARALLAVYDLNQGPEHCTLSLLDSMHFDVEGLPQKDFHPLFHVQRGPIKQESWSKGRLKALVAKASNLAIDAISIEEPHSVGCRDIRIPTPQLDYLAVLLAVMADFFGNSDRSEMKRGFADLLNHVRGGSNVARHGDQADELQRRCSEADPTGYCVSHWYPESLPPARG